MYYACALQVLCGSYAGVLRCLYKTNDVSA